MTNLVICTGMVIISIVNVVWPMYNVNSEINRLELEVNGDNTANQLLTEDQTNGGNILQYQLHGCAWYCARVDNLITKSMEETFCSATNNGPQNLVPRSKSSVVWLWQS